MSLGRWEYFGRFLDRCESPIEFALLHAWILGEDFSFAPAEPQVGAIATDSRGVDLHQQVQIDRWRVDFLLVSGDRCVIIECDGYEFHSSRDRFEADRIRDRELLAQGYTTARFTGRELNTDAPACAQRAYLLAVAGQDVRTHDDGPTEADRINALPWDEQVKEAQRALEVQRQRHGLVDEPGIGIERVSES